MLKGLNFLAVLLIFLAGCKQKTPPLTVPTSHLEQAPAEFVEAATQAPETRHDSVPPVSPVFHDTAALMGIQFLYQTGGTGAAKMFETFGGGAGWLDFDRDGFFDLYLVQGGDAYAAERPPNKLYRNAAGKRFFDVTDASGSGDRSYGQGVAIGDFDNDGFEDLFVTNLGGDILLQNKGDGTFKEVIDFASLGDSRWSTSAAWADLDGDGDLDLYVCDYVDYGLDSKIECTDSEGNPAICPPNNIAPLENRCYENMGNGTFVEVSQKWNLSADGGKSLGVVICDFNLDSVPEIFVANDTTANHLFVRQSTQTFLEQAVLLGCAASETGKLQASMGIACEDYDGNQYPDVYVTHFSDDSNTLYSNLGHGFQDRTRREGLHKPTLPFLGFGTWMCDFNCDGAMDVYVANGHVDLKPGALPWPMTPQVFSYQKATKNWVEQTPLAGESLKLATVGRGVAACDFDNDGDVDLAVTNQESPAMLLNNESRLGNWLSIDLIGVLSNREGVGARVVVECPNGTKLSRQLIGGGSYCAASQRRLFFGLGDYRGECSATIFWPYRLQQPQLETLSVNQHHAIRERHEAEK